MATTNGSLITGLMTDPNAQKAPAQGALPIFDPFGGEKKAPGTPVATSPDPLDPTTGDKKQTPFAPPSGNPGATTNTTTPTATTGDPIYPDGNGGPKAPAGKSDFWAAPGSTNPDAMNNTTTPTATTGDPIYPDGNGGPKSPTEKPDVTGVPGHTNPDGTTNPYYMTDATNPDASTGDPIYIDGNGGPKSPTEKPDSSGVPGRTNPDATTNPYAMNNSINPDAMTNTTTPAATTSPVYVTPDGGPKNGGSPAPAVGPYTPPDPNQPGITLPGGNAPGTSTGNPPGVTVGGSTWANPPGAPTAGTNPVPVVAPLADPGRTADKQALIDQLMSRAGQSTLIDPNDPNIKGQTDAYRAEQIRAARSATADAAAANSPYNTGQQAGIARMEQEKVGQNVGQFETALMGKELEARRSEIQHALDSMGGLLSDEEKNGLNRELANLNAAISQSQTTTQNQQFYAGLNQQDQQFVSQLQQGERFHNSDDAFKRMQLAQDQSQFISKLAQDGKIADMQNALEQTRLSQQDKQFILQLAQQGKYADIEAAYKQAALSQDQNQFLAKLAQTGQMAQADDLFRRMQLAQQQSQFLDRLGLDASQQQAYWDWVQRGNGAPPQ